ncbi:MAG: GNAT family N-acetyltransferase [Zymomonas mobilis subsp. pomaceae]|uniref:GCN5-related N-acetyltransferase n=1 Tax=Zymomonas mobilis subsp. pomaceae (strain ATCC 29192 / DSM 22645 / JCM 10191 / CCUG 17912 / NBRC 13757 / NCIMB 11200 / NRRL B-4491 / Barker I) TaxID=579138 RepID=F8ESS8_ZYMMT|nr:GNAT family N-acetyltransferase [Zymomonas mobilis]AEI37853.1 GCN5-related N-acetyltransferase [Zymomonas mobilis subsp. pomaceae ATCC 29192]MDX5949220.1 GNAT family N-acetyltransferase [Zymomonas mobilis subsp. pomaceae]GEB89551.1 hypothetical protein ZMO02_11880 [Zymomonas mobilis subsp. pomaceae]
MFAYSARLFLRPLWSDDLSILFDRLESTFFCDEPKDNHKNDIARYLREKASLLIQDRDPTRPHSGIFLRGEGEPTLIGITGIADECARFFCWIAAPFRGHGFATEASRMMLHFADNALRLSQLTAWYDAQNVPAKKLLAKLGFAPKEQIFSISHWEPSTISPLFQGASLEEALLIENHLYQRYLPKKKSQTIAIAAATLAA